MRVRLTMPSAARAALAALRRELALPALDFLYPPVCFLCDDPLGPSDAAVCSGCWDRFAPADAAWTELRGPLVAGGVIDELLACWLFESTGGVKDAVHLLKYRKVRSVGVRMGEELGRRIARDALFSSADFLVPVPLHRTRLRERGYNQADLLCEGIERASGIRPVCDLLVRTRYTESQTLLDRSVRRANVAGAFRLNPARAGLCAGKRIILVDDVMTTGATLSACGELVLEAGARSVLAACAALTK